MIEINKLFTRELSQNIISERISFHVDGEEIGKIQSESNQTLRNMVGMPESSEHVFVNATNNLAPFDREV